MGRANRVDAHRLHDLKLTLRRATIDRTAEGAEIMVQADSVETDLAPVEKEALLGVAFDIDANTHLDGSADFLRIDALHTFIPGDERAIEATLRFLKSGRL